MSFTDKELEEQEKTVRNKLLMVFIPIALMLFGIFYYQTHSLNYNKKEYERSRAKSFEGIVIKKKEEGDYLRAPRWIVLDNYHEERIPNEIYYEINVGDKVIKRQSEDTMYFFLKNGKTLAMDYNEFIRKRYQSLLNNKE